MIRAGGVVTGCSAEQAAVSVIDGPDGFGIDAVCTSAATAELWLVQAEWNLQGSTRSDADAVGKLIGGLLALDDRDFDRFNGRLQALSRQTSAILRPLPKYTWSWPPWARTCRPPRPQ